MPIPSSLEAPARVRTEFRIRDLEVVAVDQIAPGFRRVIFSGPELEQDFPFQEMATAGHVRILLPDEVTGELTLPVIVDARIQMPEGTRPLTRDYTVRAFAPATKTHDARLTLDFVVHSHGPAGRWAQAAEVSQRVGVGGPRGLVVYPESYRRYVLIADDTALPALARWVEEAPVTSELIARAIVSPASTEYPLPTHPGLNLEWIVADDATRVTPGLAELIGPETDTFVWAAGESSSLKPLRARVRELSAAKERIDIGGYWKRGTAEFDHHSDED